ncbi:hypothetical protein [Helicobacter macacae]|uniref:Uncharacterized protein n=1 Tax=Helicobacter macacae MIT 99-5501 TaxID=1357400 RepID=V8CE09_9HELI|nr:hypothetical protein [Helicobacter macacae]ETD25260.1 hypothetical protein HMPREF2086_00600 [Helicobacter macacae MIT 99-5501]
MAMQMTRSDFMRKDYESMASELEVEVQTLTKEQSLRIEIDSELENALKEMQSLQSQLPKEQMNSLFEQCQKNAIDAVVGHFGLAAVVLNSKDGGNVNTTHNVRKGIYASETEKQRYENRGEYDSGHYHTDKNYIAINKEQSELKKQGQSIDYMTGERIRLNDSTDLDHIVSAKTIHDDRARVLAEVDGADLANTRDNLTLTDSTLNRSKKAMTADEFIAHKKRSLDELDKISKTRDLTDREKERKAKLESIDDDKLRENYAKSKKNIDKKADKTYYTSPKPYKEALITGGIDAGKMAIHFAIGEILKEFIIGMSDELKTLFKEFGNESLGDIFKRFAKRLKQIWDNLRARWKDIIAGSFEAGIVAFFGNLVVFAINIVFTTMKRIVRIIRAGFASLYQAVKKLFDKNTPENERLFEASKIFVAGLISAVTMLSGEYITKWLYAIPGLNAILGIPLPFLDETIGDALGLCISAALGAVLSTIAIYYMDKWANDKKIAGLQIQMMTKSGEVVNLTIMQTWFAFKDGFDYIAKEANSFGYSIAETKLAIVTNGQETDKELDSWESSLKELENLTKGV